MKHFILLLALFVFTCSWSQQYFYGSISGGMQFLQKNSNSPGLMVNSYHDMMLPWFCGQESLSFKQVTNYDITLGHQVNNNLGYEISGSYLKPADARSTKFSAARTFSGEFFRVNPKAVFSVDLKWFEVYSKIGLTVVWGKLKFNQYLPDGSLPFYATLEYEYKGDLSFGFNGSLGISKSITKKIAVFGEISAVSQTFRPTTGKTTRYTVNGKQQWINEPDPYISEIEFNNSGTNNYYTHDQNKPESSNERSYALGNFGFNIGIKYIIYRRK